MQAYLDKWAVETDHGGRRGPFDGTRLTGAEASWLAEQSGREVNGFVPNLHLEGADLRNTRMKGATLSRAHLEGAFLPGTDLEGSALIFAHLEDATLNFAHLEGADLRGAWLDSKTALYDALLDDKTRLADIQWGGVGAVNLTRLNWNVVPTLGDEQGVGVQAPVSDHERVVRAYRQVAAQLRAQGMSEVADHFTYRAQVRQRLLLRRRWRGRQWLGSWLLAALAGYGYRPGRTILWYLGVLVAFAVLYLNFGLVDGHPFNVVEAAVFSVTSFHGRGFFPGGLALDNPVTVLAALEAVIGLLIEISFIATFTQRFFNSR